MIDVYVINMKERIDRWNFIKATFGKYCNLIRVEAIKNEKHGWVGCFQSHKKCLQLAKWKKLKHIVVIEDDCIPFISINDFITRLTLLNNSLETFHNWNIILGGSFYYEPIPVLDKVYLQKNLLCKVNKGFCTHLIIYNEPIYEFFINHPITAPIDNIWHNKITAHIPVPFLANQKPSFSNITRQFVSHIHEDIIKTNNELMFTIKHQKQIPMRRKTLRLNFSF
jgi:GR25 family glycosyltransferase involved in LPS biosynthesis